MRSLLDIHVLIALLDQDHAFHARAHAWWRKDQPQWASCPLTENGVVRIMASPNYSKARQFTVAELVTLLQTFTPGTKHTFCPAPAPTLPPTPFDHATIPPSTP